MSTCYRRFRCAFFMKSSIFFNQIVARVSKMVLPRRVTGVWEIFSLWKWSKSSMKTSIQLSRDDLQDKILMFSDDFWKYFQGQSVALTSEIGISSIAIAAWSIASEIPLHHIHKWPPFNFLFGCVVWLILTQSFLVFNSFFSWRHFKSFRKLQSVQGLDH